MDWLRLPPLNSLRAFAAAAETRSVKLAASRLNVTHAAVSQQIKQLEKRLGLTLIRRVGRGIELTEDGAALARDLGIGFAAIERGVERVTADAENRPVQVTMSPAFALAWLLPRIGEFQQRNREITLMLNPTAELVDLKPGGIDVAIRYRDRRWPGGNMQAVLESDMIVVATPDLVAGHDLSKASALAHFPWLQELGTNEAAEWFTFHGVVPDKPLSVHHMPGNLIMSAVRRGDGLTYTARAFVQEELQQGSLVELWSDSAFGSYYVETGPQPLRKSVNIFLTWLLDQSERVVV